MESRINYALVGLFCLLLTAGLVYFAYWLGTHGGRESYDYYRVYMSESVAGLSVDASVKYMGVSVGTVEHIGIDPKNAQRVELVLKIRRGTPITKETTAQLKFFGITGLAFIELKGGKGNAPLLKPRAGHMPVIPSKPSTLKRMDESLSLLASKSAKALEKIDLLLSHQNIKNLGRMLTEYTRLSVELRGAVTDFRGLLRQTSITEDELVAAAQKVGAASDNVRSMAARLEDVYGKAGSSVGRDVHHSLDLLDELLFQLQILTQEIQRTVRHIDQSPADLLFRRTNPRPGPGEPGYGNTGGGHGD